MPTILSRVVAVIASAFVATLSLAMPARASADKCKGGAHQSCVAVNGSKLHVNWIKSRVAPYARTCLKGHSQVLISIRHYADSNGGKDRSYCSTSWLGQETTTGTWNVKRNYTRGTTICSKFWHYTGNGAVNGYKSLGTACATVG